MTEIERLRNVQVEGKMGFPMSMATLNFSPNQKMLTPHYSKQSLSTFLLVTYKTHTNLTIFISFRLFYNASECCTLQYESILCMTWCRHELLVVASGGLISLVFSNVHAPTPS
jgi:hypothetical protein